MAEAQRYNHPRTNPNAAEARMKKLLSALFVLTASSLAHAYPTHMFWCGILDSSPAKQIYVEIEDADLASGLGKVILSQMPESANVNQGWVPFEQAQVRLQFQWGTFRGKKAITGVIVDMGRTGKIVANTTEPYDQYGSARGFVKANAMRFNYPQGVATDYCTYFLATGARPAISGSN